MDDIINLGEDLSNYLDIPNSFCDDEILRDLDNLDFVNDFDDDLIFDYDVDKNLSNPDIYKTLSTEEFYLQERNLNHLNINGNNYGNLQSNELNTIKNEPNELAEQKLMIIRELLDSNICVPTNGMVTNIQNCNNLVSCKQPSMNMGRSAVENIKPNNNNNNPRNINSKHPVILPATNISSSSLLKSPTLAATLISMQPSKVNNNCMENQNIMPGTGRVVRRNSHNAIEKRYRLSINDKIDELRHMLFLGDDSKMNKSNVLKKAIERIKFLEDENNALKCENYNFRISRNLPIINNGNSIESLNQTGSSPSSNNSDCGQSIENSPSSSSMHSSSVASGCLFMKSNENNPQTFINANRGIKRPLIYNSNNDNSININKSEKLARLLLDPKDNYVEKQFYSNEIQSNRNSNKLHSSNVPGFLLCTLALFVVSFQPFDVILKKYQLKLTTVTGGRHLLQYANVDNSNGKGYHLALFLTLAHWCVAFMLVWGSTNNRFIFRKSISLLMQKLQRFLSQWIHSTKSKTPLHSFIDLKNSLTVCCQDHHNFKIKLNDLIDEYGCSYRINPINKLFQFIICLVTIFVSFIRFNANNKQQLNDEQKIRIYLLTLIVDQSFVDQSLYSRLEIAWYQLLLYTLSLNVEVTNDTMFSKFILALSSSTGFIRRYLLNNVFKSIDFKHNLLPDKLLLFIKNDKAQKLFIKTNSHQIMNKYYSRCLDKRINPEKHSLINCYFMVHAQETIELASQIILNEEIDSTIIEQLKDIVDCCPTMLNDHESTYFSLWSCLLLALLKNQDNHNLEKIAEKLIHLYNFMDKTYIEKDLTNSAVVLKLLQSTMRLCGQGKEDSVQHGINIRYIRDILNSFNSNVVFQMLLKLCLNRIYENLVTIIPISETRLSNMIYYTNAYSKQLNNHYKLQTAFGLQMVSKFDELLHNLCQMNPLRQILSNTTTNDDRTNITNHNIKTVDDLCYKITDFLSFDRDSKLRSH